MADNEKMIDKIFVVHDVDKSIIGYFNVKEFVSVYRGAAKLLDSKYFHKFLDLLKDPLTLSHIKFANDTLQIPPVKSMVNHYRSFFSEVMSAEEKQTLGACFGYLYKYVYKNYVPQQMWIGDVDKENEDGTKQKGTYIKTASFFKPKQD